MRKTLTLLLLLAAAFPAASEVIESAYTGQFGYAEETALRPYKWIWSGVKSLVWQTRDSFVRGNMNTPVLGTVETFRGLRRGTFELGEQTFNGCIYKQVPQAKRHEEKGTVNNVVERDLLLRNVSDAMACGLYYRVAVWPAMKVVDYCPVESDEKVQMRLDDAKKIREARHAAEQSRMIDSGVYEDRVERAQRQSIGDRATYGNRKLENGRGNLLKLAKRK